MKEGSDESKRCMGIDTVDDDFNLLVNRNYEGYQCAVKRDN
jgi:hypothetical protein